MRDRSFMLFDRRVCSSTGAEAMTRWPSWIRWTKSGLAEPEAEWGECRFAPRGAVSKVPVLSFRCLKAKRDPAGLVTPGLSRENRLRYGVICQMTVNKVLTSASKRHFRTPLLGHNLTSRGCRSDGGAASRLSHAAHPSKIDASHYYSHY